MPEHYTKNTVSATFWCAKCGKATEHRVDGGRRGPCFACIAKLDAGHAQRKKPAQQGQLFAGSPAGKEDAA